jgi:hypothetical protein
MRSCFSRRGFLTRQGLRRRCSLLVFFLFMPSLLNSGLDRRGNRTMGAKARCRDRTRQGIRDDIANAISQPLQKINNESLLICKGSHLHLESFLLSTRLSLEVQNPPLRLPTAACVAVFKAAISSAPRVVRISSTRLRAVAAQSS